MTREMKEDSMSNINIPRTKRMAHIPSETVDAKKPDALVLSVALESGRFETKLRIPFPCPLETGKEALEKWLEFAMVGLRIGASEMSAVLAEKPNDK
jgi:poly-beta-hydroxyalkanoate depolymerase